MEARTASTQPPQQSSSSSSPVIQPQPLPQQPQTQLQTQFDPACNHCRAKKIKCDRKSPRCTNCRRNQLECNYSDKGKRVNQTSLVLSNLDAIQSRLGFIEGALSNVLAHVEKPAAPHSDSSSTASHDEANYMPDADDFEMLTSFPSAASTEPQIPLTCDWKNLIKLRNSGSLISFGLEAYFVLSKRLAQNFHPSTPAQAESKERFSNYQDTIYQNLLRSLSSFDNVSFFQDSQVVALPPRALIDDACDTFFQEVNPILPIFRRESFDTLVDDTYNSSIYIRDTPSVICINNIILQTLNAKARVGSSTSMVSSLDVGMLDLRSLLLKNAKRALATTKDFMAPRLLNVQALLSLTIIAQENFPVGVAEVTLGLACQVARMMGMNRRPKAPPALQPTDAEEHSKVFWSLFILDKQLSSLHGNACRLPSYDCDVALPEDEQFNSYLVTRIPLARIQEQIYFDLYSAQANGRNPTESQRNASKLIKSLERWYRMHEATLKVTPESELEGSSCAHMSLSLNFDYYNARILATKHGTDEEMTMVRLEDARKGIRLMLKARTLSGTICGSQLLQGIINYSSFVEFFEVFRDVITYPSRVSPAEDLSSLRSVVKILQDLSDNSNLSSSHSSQLLLVATAHLELATRFVEFVDLNNLKTELPPRRLMYGSDDVSPAAVNELMRNQFLLQQFHSSFFEQGSASIMDDENNLSNNFAMSMPMPVELGFGGGGKLNASSHEDVVPADFYQPDASLPAFVSDSFSAYLSSGRVRPAVLPPEPDMHSSSRNDSGSDISMFRQEPGWDLFSSCKTTYDKVWQ